MTIIEDLKTMEELKIELIALIGEEKTRELIKISENISRETTFTINQVLENCIRAINYKSFEDVFLMCDILNSIL